MSLRKNTVILLAAGLFPWIHVAHAAGTARGVVIYKDYSFDPDSQAEMADYSSVQRFGSVDTVVTPGGQLLRIFSNQDPIYVPAAGTPGSRADDVAQTIQTAERRFPQFAARLENYRRAWASVAQAAPAAKPSLPAIAAMPAQPTPDSTASPAPGAGSGRVLRTRSGQTFQSWTVSGVEGDTVVISHADGISRVPIADLPDNLYGFPDEVIARAQLLREKEAAQARADLEKAAGFPSASPAAHGRHRDKDINGDRPSD